MVAVASPVAPIGVSVGLRVAGGVVAVVGWENLRGARGVGVCVVRVGVSVGPFMAGDVGGGGCVGELVPASDGDAGAGCDGGVATVGGVGLKAGDKGGTGVVPVGTYVGPGVSPVSG